MTDFTPARLAELRAVAEHLQDAPQGAAKCDQIGRSSFDFTPKFESDDTFHRTAAFFENLPDTVLALIDALEVKTAALERVNGHFFKNRLYLTMMSHPELNNEGGEILYDKIAKIIQDTIEGTHE